MKPIVLYDLVGADGRRFSPYCWRIKLALAHKRLPFETVATRFTDIPTIAGGGHATLPVIDDGGRLIADSFAIAQYLEATYPDRPSLFGGARGLAGIRFVESWVLTLHPMISRIVLLDIHGIVDEADKSYFRASRQKRFGQPLEAIVAGREARIASFNDALAPLKSMLRVQPFLGGEASDYADYCVFGTLQWARVVSPVDLLSAEPAIRTWFDRILDLHDGLARKAAAAAP